MRLPRMKAIGGFFLAAVLSAPAWSSNTSANSALPGTLNYVEGQASIGAQALDSKSIGSAELQPGQSLKTEKGKAEILLTPGVFLRVGVNSSVRMISPSITDTEIGVDRGHAMIEVAEIHPENDIRVSEDGTTTQLLKTGLYDFDRNQELRVFDGKALVENGSGHLTVKGGREVSLAGDTAVRTQKFKKKAYEEGDLYRWSSLRSGYLAEANIDAAGIYAANAWGPWGAGWWGADWYWDPWFSAYTFIPGNEFSTARSAGVSIHPAGCMKRLSTDTGAAWDTDATTITSAPTPTTGGPAFTTPKAAITRTASTAQDSQEAAFIPDLEWRARRAVSAHTELERVSTEGVALTVVALSTAAAGVAADREFDGEELDSGSLGKGHFKSLAAVHWWDLQEYIPVPEIGTVRRWWSLFLANVGFGELLVPQPCCS